MKKPKPKFRVGQVVYVLRHDYYVRLVAPDKITQKGLDYWRDDNGTLWTEDVLRPLTRKEAGR